MDFTTKLKQKQKVTQKIIDKYLPREASYQRTIIDSIEYSLKVGGKRLRPILMQEVYFLFGGQDLIIEPFMVAIEMIHSYSLVHDDLPAMDNDDYRRGNLTTHKKYGEAMAILTGDALLNYAFEIMSFACVNNQDKIIPMVKAMNFLSQKAGIYGMIGGQVVDIESENKLLELEQLNFIHKHKTAALIEASMCVGAILANATDEEVKLISSIANKIGIAFQIQDDILDVTSTLEQLGKPIGSDDKNNKSTFVTLVGLEESKKIVRDISEKAIEELNSINKNSQFLIDLSNYLINRSN